MRSRIMVLLPAVVGAVAALGVVRMSGGQQSRPPGPNPDSQYRLGPDSLAWEGVPKGEIRGPYTLPSQAYPGTQHTYWVYVPAQYDPKTPASLMIYQDGQAFKDEKADMRAQNVMDNLIYRREIPVMIGVFINPGRRPDQDEPSPQRGWGDGFTNRGVEYNALDDKYARVICDELMPVLYKEYNISKDPEQHGIGGSSSGAIAAFTVAWQRPNEFRKVLSNVGSFTNIRGGHQYPDIILKSKKKPIRVFLCDGRNDNRGIRNGVYDEKWDWFLQNVRMQQALTKKGYDLNYTWGMNNHGQKFGGLAMPEMMRWLWRDAQPVSTDPNDMVERSFRQPAAGSEEKADSPKPDREGFYELFNGKDLGGWKVSDDPATFKVENGDLVVHGPRAHLYYMGPVQNHDFKNFHLIAEVMTFPKANSGIYFHTAYQPTGWPDKGFECQVNNSHGDPKRTGGLYDIQDVMNVAPAKDNEWFKYEIIVRGKKVTLKVDGKTTTEWTQPEGFVPPSNHPQRVIATGTIALQGHDPGSETHYKSIRIKPLK